MKQETQTQQFIKEAKEINYNAIQTMKAAQKRWSKIKGFYVHVPDYSPTTEIFIRDGENVHSKIKEFKEKRTNYKVIL